MDAPSAPPLNTFRPGTAGVAKTEVELSISGRKLLDMDYFSKSDPLCVVYIKRTSYAGQKYWKEIARTECIDNNLNPDFVTKINIEYIFEEQQFMKFEVYDMDSDSKDLACHDFIGSAECTLGQIVSARGQDASNGLVLQLRNQRGSIRASLFKSKCGQLVIKSEDLKQCNDNVELTLGAIVGIENNTQIGAYTSSIFITTVLYLCFPPICLVLSKLF